jgi:hypothetical protein
VTDRRGALAALVQDEVYRRVRRSFLVAIGASLLGAFAFGASILPLAVTGNLLLSYGLFLAVFGTMLATMLVSQFGGPFGDALAVAVWARMRAEDHWREVGAGRMPVSADQAEAWLAAHPDTETLQPQRLSAQLSAGRLEDARRTLGTYPTATPYERFDQAADGWFLDFLEGDARPFASVDAVAANLEADDDRALAAAGLALMRAHQAAVSGTDPYPALAAARPALGERASGLVGTRYVLRTWTVMMVIAAGLVGVALLFGRMTDIWG